MKKLIIILAAIFTFASFNDTFGSINSRHVWWKKRLQDISREREVIIQKNLCNEPAYALIDREIARAGEMLRAFETNEKKDNNTPVNVDEKAVRPDDTENLQNNIAELEIELISNKIKDYVGVYESLNYGREILTSYGKIYNELENNAHNRCAPLELENVIKNNSIFPMLKDFNRDKFVREYNTKRYLSVDLGRDIARLRSLAEFYRRNGILSEKPQILDDISDIKQKLNAKPSVRIGTWDMNELNFEDIDRNAIKRLIFIRRRNFWKNDSEFADAAGGIPVSVDGAKITLTIPEGWIEQRLASGEMKSGIVRYFRSIDGKSSIYIACIDPRGMDSREISQIWLDKMNRMKVKEKWGKKNNIEYVWTISKSKEKDIMELYTLPCNNRVLLVSGITSKEKYNFFKDKIDSVFNSIKPAL